MVKLPLSAHGSDEDDPVENPASSAASDVVPGNFRRSVPSDGVVKPPSIHEIETHREHIRLNLENWEKQWADVLRYERAQVQDDADMASFRRALTRAGAALAFAFSLFIPVFTDPVPLSENSFGSLSLREVLLVAATISTVLSIASLWYAGHLWAMRRRSRKSRTRPLEPPERLDVVQLLKSLEVEGNPLYYRERDVAPGLGFGWKSGSPDTPQPPSPESDV